MKHLKFKTYEMNLTIVFLNQRSNLVKERLYYFMKESVLKYNIWLLEFSRIGNVPIAKYVYICIAFEWRADFSCRKEK